MNFNILVLFFVLINNIFGLKCQELTSALTYVDEIVVLQKIFNNLQEIKNSIGLWNTRYEEHLNVCESLNKDPSIFDIRFDALPLKCKSEVVPKNCFEATACTQRSGIYKILLEKYSTEPFLVECDVKTDGGGWTLIQRRQDGSVDFYRDWEEYQKGFGNINGEFFIGLDKLHALTNYNGPQELLIAMKDDSEARQAKYSNFVIGSRAEFYALQELGEFSGDAGESLNYHLRMKFTTKDQDNDQHATVNCAQAYTGAWWYNQCHQSNLNGRFGDNTHAKGVNWFAFRKHNVSISSVKMMIRRRRF